MKINVNSTIPATILRVVDVETGEEVRAVYEVDTDTQACTVAETDADGNLIQDGDIIKTRAYPNKVRVEVK